MAATFSITLYKNFRLDTGRKFEKILKSRNGFFSRGDNTAFFMELGIEAELNERFTTLFFRRDETTLNESLHVNQGYFIACQ